MTGPGGREGEGAGREGEKLIDFGRQAESLIAPILCDPLACRHGSSVTGPTSYCPHDILVVLGLPPHVALVLVGVGPTRQNSESRIQGSGGRGGAATPPGPVLPVCVTIREVRSSHVWSCLVLSICHTAFLLICQV